MLVPKTEILPIYYDIHPVTDSMVDAARLLVESELVTCADYFERNIDELHAIAAVDESGEVLGVSCLTYPEDEDSDPHLQDTRTAAMEFLAVADKYQRIHGIGNALLKFSEYTAVRGGLDTMFLESVGTAEAFYEKHGYRILTPQEREHTDNNWLIPMVKRLR